MFVGRRVCIGCTRIDSCAIVTFRKGAGFMDISICIESIYFVVVFGGSCSFNGSVGGGVGTKESLSHLLQGSGGYPSVSERILRGKSSLSLININENKTVMSQNLLLLQFTSNLFAKGIWIEER